MRISLGTIALLSFVGTIISWNSEAHARSNEISELIEKSPNRMISRKKRAINYEDLPLSIKKRLAENFETIGDYEDDTSGESDNSVKPNWESREISNFKEDFDEHRVDKRHTVDNNEDKKIVEINRSDKRKKRDDSLEARLKKKASLEIAKLELEKVEKKVENEIRNLKKRAKSGEKHSGLKVDSEKREANPSRASPHSAHPRLLKIEVDTFEISPEILKNDADSNDRLKKSESTAESESERVNFSEQESEVEKLREKELEEQLQRRIDNVSEEVKRRADEDAKIREIEINNAKYDELMKLQAESVEEDLGNDGGERRLEENLVNVDSINGVDEHDPDVFEDARSVHESIRKRSAPVYDESDEIDEEFDRRKKRNHGERKLTKLPNDVDMNSEIEISKFKGNGFSRRSTGINDAESELKYSKFNGNDYERQSFLFPGRLHRRRRREMRPERRRKLGSYKRKRGGKFRHKHRRHSGRMVDGGRRKERSGRAAEAPLDEIQSDPVGESDAMANIANSQDAGSQIAPEYQEAFGGLPSNLGGSLTRYKRIKRAY